TISVSLEIGSFMNRYIPELCNPQLLTPTQVSHQFSRDNEQHIDLVIWAASKYLTYIETFLASQTPARNISISVNSRSSV
ncbi:hypothetical protein, partial [Stenomitos frigidus]|uniref:hypothetical protein n=1 Tax=Stenomitos frigidus TaxID=1886765 RepID=UPI0030DAF799